MYKRLYCAFTCSFQSTVHMISSEGPAIESLPVRINYWLQQCPVPSHLPQTHLCMHTFPSPPQFTPKSSHISSNTWVSTHKHTDTRTPHTHTQMHKQMHTCTDAYTQIPMQMHAHTHTCMHTRRCMHHSHSEQFHYLTDEDRYHIHCGRWWKLVRTQS